MGKADPDPYDPRGHLDKMEAEGYIARGFICMPCWTGKRRKFVWTSHREFMGRHILAFHSDRPRPKRKR